MSLAMREGTVLKQITALYGMPIKELKNRYRALIPEGHLPSNKDFLIRRIAHKIQENTFGGLSSEAAEKIETLKEELNPIIKLGKKSDVSTAPTDPAKMKPSKHLPMPGTIITKTYKGNNVAVKILYKGFEYKGRVYRSLSRVAKEITGVHQSGFVFFGI